MGEILLSPPAAFALFMIVGIAFYALGGALGATGKPHPNKSRPYTGGEKLDPPKLGLAYQDFFWLALLFSILHVAALVVSTLHYSVDVHRLGLAYLVGIGISIFVLTEADIKR